MWIAADRTGAVVASIIIIVITWVDKRYLFIVCHFIIYFIIYNFIDSDGGRTTAVNCWVLTENQLQDILTKTSHDLTQYPSPSKLISHDPTQYPSPPEKYPT